jgi:hypothetical protein
MSRNLTLGLAGALLIAAEPARAQTNGYLLGCSAAAPLGGGCATLADPTDPALLLANPAGVATLGGPALSLNAAAFLCRVPGHWEPAIRSVARPST